MVLLSSVCLFWHKMQSVCIQIVSTNTFSTKSILLAPIIFLHEYKSQTDRPQNNPQSVFPTLNEFVH